ncbi:MAG TPA: IgA Peptidase M64 [Thermoanaerobaculia bacterium]|jgi:hypothetical protein
MRIRFILATLVLVTSTSAFAARFDDLFLDKTMRVDVFHTGNHGEEVVALDRVVSDGPWPGSRTYLIDSTNLGSYYFEVIDRDTNQPVYSRGFSSVYGEWETTDDAKVHAGTFQESMRFPWPRKPVQVVLKKRDKENAFQQIWSTVIDPASRFVNKADVKPAGKVWTLFENGPPSEKVDLLVIGEGFTEAELPKFHNDAKRMIAKLFATEPFKSRQKDFNVRAIDLPAGQSGVNRPRTSDDRRTATSVQYNIFDSERYVLTFDNRAMRDIASAAPYDFLEIMVNEKTYGGGGIFNDQATASVDSAFSEYVFVHEFGHHFAGLGDEYYTSDVAYETGGEKPEPWEPNLTASGTHPKWFDMVDKDVPLPTPWDKTAFEEHSKAIQARRRQIRAENQPESVMDALFREERDWETKFLDHDQKYAGKVGAFEGAGYEPKGLYRPQVDCIMFTRDDVGFCRVCQRAISRIIDIYSH